MFQARRFAWRPCERANTEAAVAADGLAVTEAVVVFAHAERGDEDKRGKTITKAAKNIKWLAGKRGLRRVVLHSFTHLGGETADPAVALALLEEIAARLRQAGYQVWLTPFGWSCEWELAVYGEGLAKVFKA